jgi:hypothetical protein
MPFTAEVILSVQAEFAFTAAQVGIDNDSIPNFKFSHTFTNFDHITRAIRAIDVGHFKFQARPTVSDKNIHTVEGCGAQTDQHLASFRLGRWEVRIFENFRSAVLVEESRFHLFKV